MFRDGDIVVKSGESQPMVVRADARRPARDRFVICEWANGTGTLKAREFLEAELTSFDALDPSPDRPV